MLIDAGLLEKIARIRLLAVDVDGVMTDGSIVYTDEGQELKFFDVKDGHGIKLLAKSGIETAIITARKSKVVEHRAANLGIHLVYQGRLDKVGAFEEILSKTGLKASEAAYMGDDLVDLPLLLRVGLPLTVADAADEVKERVSYVTRKPGGRGAVREAAELILRGQGKWERVVASYLEG